MTTPGPEAKLERAWCKRAREDRWLCAKWVSPGWRGVPDRLFFRRGQLVMVEFKAPGQQPTPIQRDAHYKLRRHGFHVHVADDIDQYDEIMNDERPASAPTRSTRSG